MEAMSFGIFSNVGSTKEEFIKEMSKWGKKMESEGKFPERWCIQDDRLQIIGDVDLGDEPIRFPIGVVAGSFGCRIEYTDSPNYPLHIGIHPEE